MGIKPLKIFAVSVNNKKVLMLIEQNENFPKHISPPHYDIT
jgi:hypothetical protein